MHAKCDLQCLTWRVKTCLKFGFKLSETALEIGEREPVFTITTQKPNSNPLSRKAYPLHVCRKQGKSRQTFVIDDDKTFNQKFVPSAETVNWHCNCMLYQNIRKLVCLKISKKQRNQEWLIHKTTSQHTLFCQWSNVWPLKTWLYSPKLPTWPVWFLMIPSCLQEW